MSAPIVHGKRKHESDQENIAPPSPNKAQKVKPLHEEPDLKLKPLDNETIAKVEKVLREATKLWKLHPPTESSTKPFSATSSSTSSSSSNQETNVACPKTRKRAREEFVKEQQKTKNENLVLEKNQELMQLLCQLNIKNEGRKQALNVLKAAINNGQVTLVKEILKNGLDIAEDNTENLNLLLSGVKSNPEIAKILIEARPNLLFKKDKNLHYRLFEMAIDNDNMALAALIHSKGANPNCVSGNKEHILTHAVKTSLSVTQFLLNLPATAFLPETHTTIGELFSEATTFQRYDIAKALLEQAKSSNLIQARDLDAFSKILCQTLIDDDSHKMHQLLDIGIQDYEGKALAHAVQNNQLVKARVLIERGSSIEEAAYDTVSQQFTNIEEINAHLINYKALGLSLDFINQKTKESFPTRLINEFIAKGGCTIEEVWKEVLWLKEQDVDIFNYNENYDSLVFIMLHNFKSRFFSILIKEENFLPKGDIKWKNLCLECIDNHDFDTFCLIEPMAKPDYANLFYRLCSRSKSENTLPSEFYQLSRHLQTSIISHLKTPGGDKALWIETANGKEGLIRCLLRHNELDAVKVFISAGADFMKPLDANSKSFFGTILDFAQWCHYYLVPPYQGRNNPNPSPTAIQATEDLFNFLFKECRSRKIEVPARDALLSFIILKTAGLEAAPAVRELEKKFRGLSFKLSDIFEYLSLIESATHKSYLPRIFKAISSILQVDPLHYNKGIKLKPLLIEDERALTLIDPVKELKEIAKALDFSKKLLPWVTYNVSDHSNRVRMTKEEFLTHLDTFLGRLGNEVPMLGTPKPPSHPPSFSSYLIFMDSPEFQSFKQTETYKQCALHKFYEELKLKLKVLLQSALKENSPQYDEKDVFPLLCNLVEASAYCGGAWVGEVEEMYIYNRTEGKDFLFEDKVYAALTRWRYEKIKTWARELAEYTGNISEEVHLTNSILEAYGQYFGIPGNVIEPLNLLSHANIKASFNIFAHSTFLSINPYIKLIQDSIKTNQPFLGSEVFDWMKVNLIGDWKSKKYQKRLIFIESELKANLAELQSADQPRGRAFEFIWELLKESSQSTFSNTTIDLTFAKEGIERIIKSDGNLNDKVLPLMKIISHVANSERENEFIKKLYVTEDGINYALDDYYNLRMLEKLGVVKI